MEGNSSSMIAGEPLQLTTNYFKVLCKPDWCLYRYKITFVPPEDRAVRQRALLDIHRDKLGTYVFDGPTLYSATKLAEFDEPLELVAYPPEESRIVIELIGDMVPGDPHYLQLYNNLTKKCMEGLKFQLVGRNYYDVNSPIKINDYALEVWPGYLTSIEQHSDGIFMCVDVTHKVMGQESLLDVLERMIEDHGGDYHDAFKTEVIGLSVWTEYNNKIHRVEDVDFSVTPLSNVQTGDNALDLTYKEFYKSEYGITIHHSTQPLLVISHMPRGRRGQVERNFLVPELCGVAGLTEALRNDAAVKAVLSSHTVMVPQRRVVCLQQFNERLTSDPNIQKEFENWNMRLDTKLAEVTGRVLPNEKLIFGDDFQVDVDCEGDWSAAFKEKNLYFTVKLENWVVVTPMSQAFEAKHFVTEMIKSTRNFQLSEPRYIELEDATPECYSYHLEKSISDVNPQLMMVIVEGRRPEIFTRVMKKCYVENAIPCQVITDKCFTAEGQEDIATKVAIQLNCKIGGIPWTIHMPLKGLMIVGFDVCRDTDRGNRSFGAMVATLDKGLTRYFSAVSGHESGEQLTTNLIANMTKALEKYREVNDGCLPARIIVYRDGVYDGQIGIVTDHEVPRVHGAICRVYGKGVSVNFGYILISTHSHTRLFHGNQNPPLGTVVDDVITHSGRRDFFLVSQHVKDETVTPTYYNIVHDSLRLSMEKIQILTYKLTHTYFNCSNSIRVPAPVQYAHKLAYLVSQSIHTPPDPRLGDLLFFL